MTVQSKGQREAAPKDRGHSLFKRAGTEGQRGDASAAAVTAALRAQSSAHEQAEGALLQLHMQTEGHRTSSRRLKPAMTLGWQFTCVIAIA